MRNGGWNPENADRCTGKNRRLARRAPFVHHSPSDPVSLISIEQDDDRSPAPWGRIVAAWLAVVALLPDRCAALRRDLLFPGIPRSHSCPSPVSGRGNLQRDGLPFWNPYVHEGEFMLPSF